MPIPPLPISRLIVLQISIKRGHHEVMKGVLGQDIDVNEKSREGMTALCLAIQGGRTELVQMLLANHASPHEQDADSMTPLHMVVQMGRCDLTKMVLESQEIVDVNCR